jgi:hypothetical protein
MTVWLEPDKARFIGFAGMAGSFRARCLPDCDHENEGSGAACGDTELVLAPH